MERIDIAIIGGGVIGLAIASALVREDKYVFIFEKNRSFGEETSSRNSEVIHSGIYYPNNSLKHLLCLEGNNLLYEICKENNIPHKKTGKLIIARTRHEIQLLEELFEHGIKNGLNGIKILTGDEIGKYEPNIKAERAIYIPMTGVIDSHILMEYYLDKAKANGGDIIYGSEVVGIEYSSGRYLIKTKSSDGHEDHFSSDIVVNSGGLNSDEIALMAGIRANGYGLYYCKGDYFRVSAKKSCLVNGLVYTVPKPKDAGLGIHATVDLTGSMRLGPDTEYLKGREKNYSVDENKKGLFYESVKSFLPFLKEEDLSADTSGIRPKLQGPGMDVKDFIIKDEAENGFPGFIDLIGIESPGLTASPAIAKTVKGMIYGEALI